MEDNSERKFLFGGSALGVVTGFIVVGIIFGVTWLSFANKDGYGTGAAQVRSGRPALDSSVDHPFEVRLADTDAATSQLNPMVASESTPDDEVDVALGGSWRSNDCTFVTVQVVRASTGELVEALDCQRSTPQPTHEYEAYSDEALEALAYSDPIACLVLGRRVAGKEPEKSWDLMIRSSALLGGDSRPIKWLATNSFNHVTSNGEMATESMQLRYVLDELTERLEGNSDQSFDFREHYLRNSLSDADFDGLDRMVDSVLHNMKVIEEETTGKNVIRGEVS